MFNVEKNFILSEDGIKQFIKGSEFLSEKTFTEAYYDTAEYALTKNDIWLRKRGEKFELKLPMLLGEKKNSQQYQKIEGEEKIREIFAIAPVNDFGKDIKVFGYEPFCEYRVTRKKFKKEGFVIESDSITYNNGNTCVVIGIKAVVEEKKQIMKTLEKIEKFVQKNGVDGLSSKGAVLEYLEKNRPEHYRALVAAEIVNS